MHRQQELFSREVVTAMYIFGMGLRSSSKKKPERVAPNTPGVFEALPESLIGAVCVMLEQNEAKSLATAARAFAQCGTEVWSEVARLAFSRSLGESVPACDVRQRVGEFKKLRCPRSWPSRLSTWDAHGDIRVTHANGLVKLEYSEKCTRRSNRCVAGDRPFGSLAGPSYAVPAVRGNERVWRAMRGAYFEVSLAATSHSKPLDVARDAEGPSALRGCVAVGLCTSRFALKGKQPGWDDASWGVHADDGLRFHGFGMGSPFGPTFVAGDTVGCGAFCYDASPDVHVFYTLNGNVVDNRHAFLINARKYPTNDLHPCVGMDTPRLSCTVNLGIHHPFKFDLDTFLTAAAAHRSRARPRAALRAPPRIALAYYDIARQPALGPPNFAGGNTDDSDDDDDDDPGFIPTPL